MNKDVFSRDFDTIDYKEVAETSRSTVKWMAPVSSGTAADSCSVIAGLVSRHTISTSMTHFHRILYKSVALFELSWHRLLSK